MVERVQQLALTAATALAFGLVAACESATGPGATALVFTPSSVDIGEARQASVRLENLGERAVGPLDLMPGPVTRDGTPVAGVRLAATPDEIARLDPGRGVTVSLSLLLDAGAPPGSYATSLDATLEGVSVGSLAISFLVSAPPPTARGTLTITAGPAAPRQGDVVVYTAEARDSAGAPLTGLSVNWSVVPAKAGLTTGDGRFVGYTPGPASIVASASGLADTLAIEIGPRSLSGAFTVVGRGVVSDRFTSDLWAHGDFAYTGTWNCRNGLCGDRLHVWDVSNSSAPTLTDVVVVDAGTVNDVKVRADGAIAVITHEHSSDGRNGITLLDLADPAHPIVITRFSDGLEPGVHNVWIEDDYVFVAVDGAGSGLHVLDISDPASPREVARYDAGSSFLHDAYVRQGLAFLSHWNAGLVILDVGNGIAGGRPEAPVEVSRIATEGGQTHNAWYWPATGYVFVGEEDFNTPGMMHVVDASDLRNPTEVASFQLPLTAPHNFWLDEDRAILYAAWYENGLRAIDVSGTLLGQLDRQGREIATSQYGTGVGCTGGSATCTWAPQLHRGLVYVSDLNSGLWVLEPSF